MKPLKPLVQLFSQVIGLFDYAFLLLRVFGSARPKFFRLGYGDLDVYQKRTALSTEGLTQGTYKFELCDEDIKWGNKTLESSITIEEGCFLSPLADILPEESAQSRFHLVKPIHSEKGKSDVYIIMLPATGETYIFERLRMARKLAQKYGWSSIIMTAPYYGSRKPKAQTLFFIDSVKDILLQSQAVIEESAALSRYFLKQKGTNGVASNKVCFTGFSYGASMASCASVFALASGGDGSRLACAPYVGCASPICLADGVLETSVDWNALKPKHNVSEIHADTHAKLYNLFDETQLSVIPCDVVTKDNNPLAVVKGYSMRHDAFIRPRYALALEAQLAAFSTPTKTDFSMEFLAGGHIAGAMLRTIYHHRLVVETVQSLTQV